MMIFASEKAKTAKIELDRKAPAAGISAAGRPAAGTPAAAVVASQSAGIPGTSLSKPAAPHHDFRKRKSENS